MTTSEGLIQLQRQIYREAQATGTPLPQIMPWLLDRRNLEAAWQRVSDADGAKTPGVDGRTTRDVRHRKDRWLSQISNRLYRGEYRASDVRFVDVPKGSSAGGTRRLGILTVDDRLVHAALKQVFEPILEPAFSEGSFGFRPGRSVASALDAATRQLSGRARRPALQTRPRKTGPEPASRSSSDSSVTSPPFPYVCKLDVANCFDTIDHRLLLEQLARVTSDDNVLSLIEHLLFAGSTVTSWLHGRRRIGVVQGSAFSPLLCNFYLDRLDKHIEARAEQSRHGLQLLRYADDLLILAQSRSLAVRSQHDTADVLRQLRQRLKRAKSAVKPARLGVRWLGVDIRPREDGIAEGAEFTYYVPAEKVSKMLERIEEMTVPPSKRIDPAAFDLGRWIVSINDQLRDWWHSYMFAENASAVFRKLDEHAQERVGELLFALTGLRRRALNQEFRVRLPRGFSSWQTGGSRLVVLSSLAPRQPYRLVRRPAWMQRPRGLRKLRQA